MAAVHVSLDKTLVDRAAAISQRPSETIVPEKFRSGDAAPVLEQFKRSAHSRPMSGSLRFERTIGEGGMGIIRLAEQLSLARNVATKSLKGDVPDGEAMLRLLREAWVTAALEHPNVVPIYDLGADDEGRPIIVLKHIEGTAWSELIGDASEVSERFGAADLLEWNIRILIQVANALDCAHSRGIVHRDLKPANVMVGAFGVVYLLDWGIAVCTRDDGTGRFPLATHATELAGTLNYMAPELLGGEAATERTDIYLLGATLYEIACGTPPHSGDNVMAVVSKVVLSEPNIGAGVPTELAAIIRRAMCRTPADRFETVRDVRIALEEFLRHRHANAVTSRGYELLDSLKAAIAAKAADEAPRAFAECRFAFRTAIDAWPESERARAGLDACHRAIIDYELERDDPSAAGSYVRELLTPDPALDARVQAAMQEHVKQAARIDSLVKIGQEHDPSVGARTRLLLGTVLSGLWIIAHLVLGLLAVLIGPSYVPLFLVSIGAFVAAVAAALWGRESMLGSQTNRTVVAGALFACLAQIGLYTGGAVLDVPPATAAVFTALIWAAVSSMTSFALGARPFLFLGVAFFAAFAWSAMFPEHVFFALAVAQLVFIVPVSRAARKRFLERRAEQECAATTARPS